MRVASHGPTTRDQYPVDYPEVSDEEVVMAQRPRQLTPHRSGLDAFGSELRSWRVRRGLSQDALGRLVHVSGDLIGKVEKAVRRPTRMMVESCDAALEAHGAL